MSRILWLAIGEARGHLMRARLIHELLADTRIRVDIVTTNESAQRFLSAAGLHSERLPGDFRLHYDDRQNLLVDQTRRAFDRYAIRGLFADVAYLRSRRHRYSLMVNDSFHPALLSAALLPGSWRTRIVDVFGEHLREAVADGVGPSQQFLFERAIARAHANVVHTLETPTHAQLRLTPLIAQPRPRPDAVGVAAVYLNPRFSDPALASGIEQAVAEAGLRLHAVGEGMAQRPDWRATDMTLPDVVASADVLIAAPGMGTLSQVHAYGTPLIALVSGQPEQRLNLRRLPPRATTVHVDSPALSQDLARRLIALPPRPHAAERSAMRVDAIRSRWRSAFIDLTHQRNPNSIRRQAA